MPSTPDVPRAVRSWIPPTARVGYAAKGVVYVTIGGLAAKAALNMRGGRTTDTEGAMESVGRQPLGDVLLYVLALGLLCYALWRVVQAVFDADDKGGGLKGLAIRAGYLGSALVYAGLAYTAFEMAQGGSGGRSEGVEHWTGRAMAEPLGTWAVALAGAGVMCAGAYQFVKGVTAKFEKRMALEGLSSGERAWNRRIGRFGLFARGVTFLIIGWFLVRAAMNSDPGEALGLAGSLRVLRQQAYGDLLLGVVAFGLVAYGLHALMMSRYRRVAA